MRHCGAIEAGERPLLTLACPAFVRAEVPLDILTSYSLLLEDVGIIGSCHLDRPSGDSDVATRVLLPPRTTSQVCIEAA